MPAWKLGLGQSVSFQHGSGSRGSIESTEFFHGNFLLRTETFFSLVVPAMFLTTDILIFTDKTVVLCKWSSGPRSLSVENFLVC